MEISSERRVARIHFDDRCIFCYATTHKIKKRTETYEDFCDEELEEVCIDASF